MNSRFALGTPDRFHHEEHRRDTKDGIRRAVEEVKGIHQAQLLTYMKLAGVKTGLLINFNVTRLKTGIKRFIL